MAKEFNWGFDGEIEEDQSGNKWLDGQVISSDESTTTTEGSVIDDYVNDMDLSQDNVVEELKPWEKLEDEVEEEVIDGNWMQQNAPEWFSDWLYEGQRPSAGDLELYSDFGEISEDDITEVGTDSKLDRLSDVARQAIQSGAYMADFWKDLAYVPYNLYQGENLKDQWDRINELPEWAEDIGYVSERGKDWFDHPTYRAFQENILPFAGAGVVGAAMKVPKAGKLLQYMFPTTNMMNKMTKGNILQNIGNWAYGKPWGPMLPRPGSMAFNIGIPWAIGQGTRKAKGEPSVYDMIGAVDFSPVSSAYAGIPSGANYAAGQWSQPTQPSVRSRHPREMMEQSYNVRRRPELTTQSDYEALQEKNIAENKPKYLAYGQ